jgi:Fe-S cluster biogenesis protein NfuA
VDTDSTQPPEGDHPDATVGATPDATRSPDLSDEERGARLAALNSIIELMRPAVQSDGGDLALISADVVTGVVEVQLQGACSSCAVSSSTLQGGVERILHDRLDWVTEVLGGVDDSVDPFVSESMGRGGYVPSF